MEESHNTAKVISIKNDFHGFTYLGADGKDVEPNPSPPSLRSNPPSPREANGKSPSTERDLRFSSADTERELQPKQISHPSWINEEQGPEEVEQTTVAPQGIPTADSADPNGHVRNQDKIFPHSLNVTTMAGGKKLEPTGHGISNLNFGLEKGELPNATKVPHQSPPLVTSGVLPNCMERPPNPLALGDGDKTKEELFPTGRHTCTESGPPVEIRVSQRPGGSTKPHGTTRPCRRNSEARTW